MFSPEDVAWADSCLSKDPGMLDSGWNSLRDALFTAFNAQHDPSEYKSEDSPERANMDVVFDEDSGTVIDNPGGKTVNGIAAVSEGTSSGLSSEFQSPLYDLDEIPFPRLSKQMEIHSTQGRNDHHKLETTPLSIADTSDRAEASGDEISNHEDVDSDPFWSKHKMEEVFLPTYDENLKDLGLSDPEVDFVFQESKLQQSTEEIFVIWDFDSTPEENDIVKQLNKALAGNPAPPFLDDSESWIGLQDRSVDDIISGIADLSLSQNLDKEELA
ncbi:hypothetical protein AAHA92_14912 [Salvia divinorum]|uniref:Uncharacterized protein n=1 Tax=Salvia divinorum TaxID=28513 RepID=A0ABD1HEE0_SALDI